MTVSMTVPILRVARPSGDLNGLLRFYCDGLGFMALCRFEDHVEFDWIPWDGKTRPTTSSSRRSMATYL